MWPFPPARFGSSRRSDSSLCLILSCHGFLGQIPVCAGAGLPLLTCRTLSTARHAGLRACAPSDRGRARADAWCRMRAPCGPWDQTSRRACHSRARSAHANKVVFDGSSLAIPPIGRQLAALGDTVVDAGNPLGQRTWLASEPVVPDKDRRRNSTSTLFKS